MASLSVLMALLSISILSLSLRCQADLIADICVQSAMLSPSYCAETLRSDPHTRGADRLSLARISIKKAKAAVRDTVTVAEALQNPNNSGIVKLCRDVCRIAMEELHTISQKLDNLDRISKYDLPNKLSAAATHVGTCDDSFEESKEGMPAELKEASRIAQGHIFVVLIIANML